MNIAWCQATGVYAKMTEDVVYISESMIIPDTPRSKFRTVEALSITHFIPPFIILAIGLVLSAITFCVEKCRQKALRARKGPLNQERWGFPPGRGQGGGGGGRRPIHGQAGKQGENQARGGIRPNAGRGVN